MQAGKDQLNAGDAVFRVNVGGHAAAVILYLQRLVFVQRDFNMAGKARQRLIHAVVNDFLGEMIGPGCVGVHTGAFAHRVEATEYFNCFGVVVVGYHESLLTARLITLWLKTEGC